MRRFSDEINCIDDDDEWNTVIESNESIFLQSGAGQTMDVAVRSRVRMPRRQLIFGWLNALELLERCVWNLKLPLGSFFGRMARWNVAWNLLLTCPFASVFGEVLAT